ncbi:MAG TPA: hypothetical protein VIU61_28175 [Kofleriaceae bacterium]
MTRSEFLRFVAGLGTLTLAAAACKKSEDGQDPVDAPGAADAAPIDSPSGTTDGGIDAPPMACSAPKTTIGGNHGHSFVVPPADVAAGVEKSYNIKGGSAHPHTVVVTAAMFADLKMNKVVTANSSEDADHIHTVTVSCG